MPAKFDHRTFVRLDHGYPENPKVMPLSDAAFRAHVEAMCWSSRQEQDGVISKAVANKKWRPRAVAELVAARLFDDVGDAYEVHDYLDFNRSAEEIDAYRSAKGEAGSYGNHKRWHIARRKWEPECEHCKKEGRLAIAK